LCQQGWGDAELRLSKFWWQILNVAANKAAETLFCMRVVFVLFQEYFKLELNDKYTRNNKYANTSCIS